MDRLKCFKCEQLIANGWNEYVRPLQYTHGFTINRGGGEKGFECAQGNCKRRFLLFGSLKRHIEQFHQFHVDLDDAMILDEHADNVNDAKVVDEEFNYGPEVPFNKADNQNQVHNHYDYENLNPASFIRTSIVRMIGILQAKPSMTGTTLMDVLDEFEHVFLTTVDVLKEKVKIFLSNKNMAEDVEAKELIKNFEFESPFDGCKTLSEQVNALKINCNYIDGKEIPLGDRIDNVLNKESDTTIPRLVKETYQYVPVIEVLTLILRNPEIRAAILSERPSNNDLLSSFIDGDYFKQHPFFQQHPHALRIQFYYDDLEIVESLGSKTGVHKLGVFFTKLFKICLHI